MGNTYYIVAIEVSSSKISGAVGIETTEGMRILSTASIEFDGFVSKGIVRNVDKTSEAITSIIKQAGSRLKIISTPESSFEMTVSRSRVDDFLEWIER